MELFSGEVSRYSLNSDGRIVRVETVLGIPINKKFFNHRSRWNYADEEHQWGMEKQSFAYDPQGRLIEATTARSLGGTVWRIMSKKRFDYVATNNTFSTRQTIADGLLVR